MIESICSDELEKGLGPEFDSLITRPSIYQVYDGYTSNDEVETKNELENHIKLINNIFYDNIANEDKRFKGMDMSLIRNRLIEDGPLKHPINSYPIDHSRVKNWWLYYASDLFNKEKKSIDNSSSNSTLYNWLLSNIGY
tara:strand:+ start:7871 stop:8287 length:417 start_codon:yes stop_codon:yes gene_type:complete